VTVLSTIEKRRKKQEQSSKHIKPPIEIEDMSGELQTIPARHGVATFVPRGRTIKVINTYGKQVVSMWAFTLGAPPEDSDEDIPGDEEIEKEAKKLQEAAEKEEGEGGKVVEPDSEEKEASDEKKTDEQTSETQTSEEKGQSKTDEGEEAKKEHEVVLCIHADVNAALYLLLWPLDSSRDSRYCTRPLPRSQPPLGTLRHAAGVIKRLRRRMGDFGWMWQVG